MVPLSGMRQQTEEVHLVNLYPALPLGLADRRLPPHGSLLRRRGRLVGGQIQLEVLRLGLLRGGIHVQVNVLQQRLVIRVRVVRFQLGRLHDRRREHNILELDVFIVVRVVMQTAGLFLSRRTRCFGLLPRPLQLLRRRLGRIVRSGRLPRRPAPVSLSISR